jgi:periplasmic copper chaperone A
MKSWIHSLSVLAGGALLLAAPAALAHISISGPAFAGSTHVARFGMSHGCDGADTTRVRIQIPTGVTSVRPMPSAFGNATVEKDATSGEVIAVTWAKPEASILAEDLQAYEFALRFSLPNKPFQTLYFPTTQTCRDALGAEVTVEWSSTTAGHGAHGADGGTEAEDHPAPSLILLPPRVPGWNRYVVEEHLHDLPAVFRDAQIVWSGKAAWSFNPNVQTLIDGEPDTEALFEIHPGTEIWVKY